MHKPSAPKLSTSRWRAVTCLLGLACVINACAQQPGLNLPPVSAPLPGPGTAQSDYTQGRASADGIGKRYLGREIAGVMGWQGAAWLEREEREREERTDLLMAALALRPGMVVADIGAGTGYLSRRMASAVAPTGKVLAVDVQPEMIKLLQALAKEKGLNNVVPLLGAEDDVRLAPQTVDLAIMVDVYHELAFPREVLSSIVLALKPGGRVVFIEYRAEDPSVPIKALHKMSQAQVKREVAALPPERRLLWETTDSRLPWQHMMVFRKP
jgi:ubiquinone/menaquinone biosynthesis C-methylase UbiE